MSDPLDPPIQSQEYPELLDIQPSSFRVDLLLHTDIFLDLHLTNLTPQLVTFKVKTTARDRYQLKPTQGYIPPHATKQCKIVLSALTNFPDPNNTKTLRDKFLVQSVAVTSEVDDLGRFWKEREGKHAVKEGRYAYAEQIVKCKLNVPMAGGGGGGGDSPSKVEREEREERREDATGITGGSGGGVVITEEVKDQQLSAQKQQPALPTTTTTATPQRLAYPPAITITSTPTQLHQLNHTSTTTQQQPNTTAALSSSSSSAYSQPSQSITTNQHDSATYQPSHSTTATAASASAPSVPALSSSSGRSKEYNDLMEFTVRLTAQMEREKADAAIIADKYNKSLAHIATLQKRLVTLTAQQQRDRNETTATAAAAGERSGGEEEKSSKQPLSLSSSAAAGAAAGGDSKGEKAVGGVEKVGSGGVVGMRDRLMSGDGVRNNSGGLSWQIYQIILVAIIAFVLGRLFSK